jgi:Tol biopolymer transport system component
MHPAPTGTHQATDAGDDRLDSWKAIAHYLGRSVTTVQRWEQQEGLPVQRLAHAKKGSVFASRHELAEWQLQRTRRSTGPAHENEIPAVDAEPDRRLSRAYITQSVVLGLLAAGAVLAWAMSSPKGPAPEPPFQLVARSPRPGHVVLTWKDGSSNETRFEVSRFGKVVSRPQANAAGAEFTNLDAGTSYHWDVRACNANGCSAWHGVVGKTPDGTDPFVETNAQSVMDGAPAIVFASSRDTGSNQIYRMNADGSSPTRLTHTSANDVEPVWSPDRTRIAFTSNRTGFSEVFVMNADGSAQVNLTNRDPAQDTGPTWSPDGSRIAFASTRSGDYEVWVMNADGSNPIKLTNAPGPDGQPAWSPDGSRIAFVSHRNGGSTFADIYVMRAHGSGQTRLTTDRGDNAYPVWSPDSSRIAYRSVRDGNGEVYVMNADGSHQTNLTYHPSHDEMPSWSPDGRRIAFGTNRDGTVHIYGMNPDGSGLVRLTHSPGGNFYPDWGLPYVAWSKQTSPTTGLAQPSRPKSTGTSPATRPAAAR